MRDVTSCSRTMPWVFCFVFVLDANLDTATGVALHEFGRPGCAVRQNAEREQSLTMGYQKDFLTLLVKSIHKEIEDMMQTWQRPAKHVVVGFFIRWMCAYGGRCHLEALRVRPVFVC